MNMSAVCRFHILSVIDDGKVILKCKHTVDYSLRSESVIDDGNIIFSRLRKVFLTVCRLFFV